MSGKGKEGAAGGRKAPSSRPASARGGSAAAAAAGEPSARPTAPRPGSAAVSAPASRVGAGPSSSQSSKGAEGEALECARCGLTATEAGAVKLKMCGRCRSVRASLFGASMLHVVLCSSHGTRAVLISEIRGAVFHPRPLLCPPRRFAIVAQSARQRTTQSTRQIASAYLLRRSSNSGMRGKRRRSGYLCDDDNSNALLHRAGTEFEDNDGTCGGRWLSRSRGVASSPSGCSWRRSSRQSALLGSWPLFRQEDSSECECGGGHRDRWSRGCCR